MTSRPPPIWRRVSARLFDIGFLFAITLAVPSAFELVVLEDMLGATREASIDAGQAAINLFALIGWPLYFVVLWSLGHGRTLGMIAFDTRLVRSDGGSLSIGRATFRLVALVIASLPLCIGLVWMLVDRKQRGWHDLVAGTRTIGSVTSAGAVAS